LIEVSIVLSSVEEMQLVGLGLLLVKLEQPSDGEVLLLVELEPFA